MLCLNACVIKHHTFDFAHANIPVAIRIDLSILCDNWNTPMENFEFKAYYNGQTFVLEENPPNIPDELIRAAMEKAKHDNPELSEGFYTLQAEDSENGLMNKAVPTEIIIFEEKADTAKQAEYEDRMQPCVRRPVLLHTLKIDEPFLVNSFEGVFKGKAGDYLMRGPEGRLYVCKESDFDKSYRLIPAEETK